jgi:hypothetical protein
MPPSNLVFRQFRETIHVDERAKFDPKRFVYLAVDPSAGTAPYAVCAVQFWNPGDLGFHPDKPPVDAVDFAYVVDLIYERGMVDEEVIDIAMKRPWWKNVKGGAIDVEAPDSKKRWKKFGGVSLWSQKVDQIEGIRRLQSFLYYKKNPDTQIYELPPHILVSPLIPELPHEFRNYKRAMPSSSKSGLELEPKEVPPQNQPNHALKALWYLLIGRYGYVKSGIKARVVKQWQNPMKRSVSFPSSR